MKSLRIAMLNEGLEALGTDEYKPDGMRYFGAFEESGLEHVRFPSTLKRIEYNTFMNCHSLKSVDFPEALEHIGMSSFVDTGIESVEFPVSLRAVEQCAFCLCKKLRCVKFEEGLEVLGVDKYPQKGEGFPRYYGAFAESAV